ncbi:hypothetical protein AB0M00_31400 [Streptomyces chartreusis]|uniref:hypothetical protein n=1 Tax=Streptomyces chartreusis TaxID=1969 RepID=UPI003417D8A3
MSSPTEWVIYRVWFPAPTEKSPRRKVSMEVSAHPLKSRILVKHQVWLLVSQKGYDVDPTEGGIEVIGTEIVKQEESK